MLNSYFIKLKPEVTVHIGGNCFVSIQTVLKDGIECINITKKYRIFGRDEFQYRGGLFMPLDDFKTKVLPLLNEMFNHPSNQEVTKVLPSMMSANMNSNNEGSNVTVETGT